MFETEAQTPRWKLAVWGLVLFLWIGWMAALVFDMINRLVNDLK